MKSTVSQKNGKWEVDYVQPSIEETDALLFNLRVFVQNKDDISLSRLGDLLTDPGLSNEWKAEYLGRRKILNDRLNEVAIQGLRGYLTYGELFRMVLFGKLSHRTKNDKQYKLFQKWVTDTNEWQHMFYTFHTVVIWILVTVINIAVASREELKRVENKAE